MPATLPDRWANTPSNWKGKKTQPTGKHPEPGRERKGQEGEFLLKQYQTKATAK